MSIQKIGAKQIQPAAAAPDGSDVEFSGPPCHSCSRPIIGKVIFISTTLIIIVNNDFLLTINTFSSFLLLESSSTLNALCAMFAIFKLLKTVFFLILFTLILILIY